MRTEQEAVAMIDPRNLDTLLHPQFDEKALRLLCRLAKDLALPRARPAARSFSTRRMPVAYAEKGEKVVLVRLETSPEDITGMKAAQGILTVRGGMTSMRRLSPEAWVPARVRLR